MCVFNVSNFYHPFFGVSFLKIRNYYFFVLIHSLVTWTLRYSSYSSTDTNLLCLAAALQLFDVVAVDDIVFVVVVVAADNVVVAVNLPNNNGLCQAGNISLCYGLCG